MKASKGITLISLIMYIIGLCITLGILSVVTNMFYKNTDYLINNSKNVSEYNKFAMYFIEDVKKNKTAQITENKDGKEIIFEDGTTYTYVTNSDFSIYRNKVKICNRIGFCKFTKREETVNDVKKTIINVHIAIKANGIFETTNDFVLKYW